MDSQILFQKSPKSIQYIAYALVALSILSCCSRPDYNIIIGFLALLLRSHHTSNSKKLFTKAVLHIVLLSCIIDILWIFKYTGFWRHEDERSDLWKSLALIHNTAYFCGFLEFLLKLPLVYFFYKEFKLYGTSIGELFSVKYSQ